MVAMCFLAKLTNVLNEDAYAPDTPVPDNALTTVRELAKELEEAKQNVADLEQRYSQAYEQLAQQLAARVQQSHPKLDVGHKGGNCTVGYMSKSLSMRPDLDTGLWAVNSPDKRLARRFQHRHGMATGLDGEMGALAQAIVQFFTDHYRTL